MSGESKILPVIAFCIAAGGAIVFAGDASQSHAELAAIKNKQKTQRDTQIDIVENAQMIVTPVKKETTLGNKKVQYMENDTIYAVSAADFKKLQSTLDLN